MNKMNSNVFGDLWPRIATEIITGLNHAKSCKMAVECKSG